MKTLKSLFCLVLTSILLLLATPALGQLADDSTNDEWEFVVAPYLLMGGVTGESTVGVVGPSQVELDFGDVLEKLQFAFMIRGEVYKGNWGLITDYFYMKLGDDIDTPGELLVADIELEQSIFELFISRRFRQDWGWVDVYGGIRYWDYGLDLSLEGLPQVSGITFNEGWLDPVIGGRIFFNASDRFLAGLRADIGGFGAGSDFTYTLQPGVGYHFSDWFTLMLQYKYLYTDYNNDKEGLELFAYKAATNGPLLGLVFRF